MVVYLFTQAILNNEPIKLYNQGAMKRDFTYIDDMIDGMFSILFMDNISNKKKYNAYNIGKGQSISIIQIVKFIEEILGKKAIVNLKALPKGDVMETNADMSKFYKEFGYLPQISIREGLVKFIDWYKKYSS